MAQQQYSIFNNPYLATLRKAWQYATGHRKKFLFTYFLFLISNIVSATYPIFWGWFINELQLQGTDAIRYAWWYGGIYLSIHLVDWAFHGTGRVLERELAFDVGQNYLEDLYHKAVHLPVSWHKDHHSGKTINRIRKAYEALKSFLDTGFRYVHTFGKFTFAFIAIIYFSPLFGTIAVLIGLLIVYIIFQFDKHYIRAAKETNEREHVVSSTLFDSLSNIVTVITLRLEKRMQIGLSKRISHIFPPFRRKVVVNEWKWFTTDMLVALIYAITVIGFVTQNWTPGEVFLVGGLVTLVGYVNQFSSVFHDFAWLYTEVVQYDTDIKTADNIQQAYKEQHRVESEEKLPNNWQSLYLQRINFSHEAEDFAALERANNKIRGLRDVAIRIQRGEKIALIGESGSGKSTLLALLRGLYPAQSGTLVEVDGELHEGLSLISNHVTLFPQEPEIFENTIEYNITLGLSFEQKEIENALKTAHFAEVLNELPKGLQSNIQEKGVNLSGGQKQRLALARGVFVAKFSDIILLDEPTSSVDPKTEMKIYEQLFEQFRDKAVVSSLHRLHLLPKFDYIYILDVGKVVAEGSFEQLHAHSPIFQELWQHQEQVANAVMYA
ncbi:MAG: ABC transporter ATP-binding protein [Bacteroidota bacterium]